MFRIPPNAPYADIDGVFSSLVQLAQNAHGDSHVLDAIIRLAFVYGVASVPGIEQDAARAKVIDQIRTKMRCAGKGEGITE